MFLDGIRVLDFTRLLPGPYATLRLADLGAEICKVEDKHGGDPARHMGVQVGHTGAVFLANYRKKQSIYLDLKQPSDILEAHRWMETTDVIIESFRPGVADRLGIGYETAKSIKPDVIYCALTGYGQNDALSHLAGHDLNYLARSGVQSLLVNEANQPILPKIQFADLIGGIVACEAILAALVQRGTQGIGCYLDISMTHALMGLLNAHALLQTIARQEQGSPELGGSIVCYNLYATKDHRYMSLAALEPKFWQVFCEQIAHPEWIPLQFSPAIPGHPVFEAVKSLFQEQTFEAWATFGEQVDCCLQPVLSLSEAMSVASVSEHQIVCDVALDTQQLLRYVHTHAGGFPQTPWL